jgi:hypothetical protein
MRIVDWLFGRRPQSSNANESLAPERSTTSHSRDEAPPPKCSANPGRTRSGRISFDNGAPDVVFDLYEITASVLRSAGHEVIEHKSWLEVNPSGFVLQPLLVELQLQNDGGVSSLTTIDVRHPQLIPDGLFEYQHSTGNTVDDSLRKGIEGWARIDLPVLLDALLPQPQKCSMWKMTFPATDGNPARTRRAMLGAVSYYAKNPPTPQVSAAGGACEREHSFCTCCLLTRNFEAFRSQIESNQTLGIRFYAMRDQDGKSGADCRINGEDYEPGMESLRTYVGTWPEAGFEFRKQYVLLYTMSNPDDAEPQG